MSQLTVHFELVCDESKTEGGPESVGEVGGTGGGVCALTAGPTGGRPGQVRFSLNLPDALPPHSLPPIHFTSVTIHLPIFQAYHPVLHFSASRSDV